MVHDFGCTWSGLLHHPTHIAGMALLGVKKRDINWSRAPISMGVQVLLMTTSTCFIRPEAPGCSTTSSEMEAIKPAQLAVPLKQPSDRRSGFQLPEIAHAAERPLCRSAGRDHYRKSRELSLHIVPDSKIRLIATVFLRSFRLGLFHLLPSLSLIIF